MIAAKRQLILRESCAALSILWAVLSSIVSISFASSSKTHLNNSTQLFVEVDAKNVSAHCGSGGSGLYYVIIQTDKEVHTLISRRAFGMENCRLEKKSLDEFIKSSKRIWAAGTNGDKENDYVREKDDNGQWDPPLRGRKAYYRIFEWIANEKNECESYFVRDSCKQSDLEAILQAGKPI